MRNRMRRLAALLAWMLSTHASGEGRVSPQCATDHNDSRLIVFQLGEAMGVFAPYWDAGVRPAYGIVGIQLASSSLRVWELQRAQAALFQQPLPEPSLASLQPIVERMKTVVDVDPSTAESRREFARLHQELKSAMPRDLEWFLSAGYVVGKVHAYANLENDSALSAQGAALDFDMRIAPAQLPECIRDGYARLLREIPLRPGLRWPREKRDFERIGGITIATRMPMSCAQRDQVLQPSP